MSEHASFSVIGKDDIYTVHPPIDQEVNWMLPVQGQSHPVQVKEPYIGNLNGYL